MSQHDFEILTSDANTGLSFRNEVNSALQALATLSASGYEPSTTYPYMLWADSNSGVLRQRNSTDTGWITVGTLDTTNWGLGENAFETMNCPSGTDPVASSSDTLNFIEGNGINITGNATSDNVTIGVNAKALPVAPRQVLDLGTVSGTIEVNVSGGYYSHVRATISGAVTLGNPIGMLDAQGITFALKQSPTGGDTVSLDTKYRFGTDLSSITSSSGANIIDYLGIRRHDPDDRFEVMAFSKGYASW